MMKGLSLLIVLLLIALVSVTMKKRRLSNFNQTGSAKLDSLRSWEWGEGKYKKESLYRVTVKLDGQDETIINQLRLKIPKDQDPEEYVGKTVRILYSPKTNNVMAVDEWEKELENSKDLFGNIKM